MAAHAARADHAHDQAVVWLARLAAVVQANVAAAAAPCPLRFKNSRRSWGDMMGLACEGNPYACRLVS